MYVYAKINAKNCQKDVFLCKISDFFRHSVLPDVK